MIKKHLERGQSIIEVLVALSVAVILISTAVAVVLTALKSSQNSKIRNQAYRYAQEGLETVRRMRDSNFSEFNAREGEYCLDKDSHELTSPCTQSVANVDMFLRKISITQTSDCGVGVASVSATVAWNDTDCTSGGFCHTVNAVTCLIQISPIPTP